jgi:acyl-CoA thioester hydrolase
MFEVLDIPKQQKLPHIMVNTACEYVQPALFGDKILVRSRVTNVGTKSFEIEHVMHRADPSETVLARGLSKHVMFDYQANRTIPVTDEFKNRIISYQGGI